MADRYLLESGSPDGYLLEDGSGVLLLNEEIVEIVNHNNTTVTYQGDGVYRIAKTGGSSSSYDASAVSNVGVSGDFVLRLKPITDSGQFVGLSASPLVDDTTTIDFSWQLYTGFGDRPYISGVAQTGFLTRNTYAWIWRSGTTVGWGRGPDLATAQASPDFTTTSSATLYFDSTFADLTEVTEAYFYIPVPAYSMAAGSGAFTLTGSAASLPIQRKLTASSAAYVLSGSAMTPRVTMPAASASYALAGSAVGLAKGFRLTALSAAYVLTGKAAGLPVARRLTAASASYALNGSAATLRVSMPAASGAFVLNGSTVNLKAGRRLAANSASYALNGSSVGLVHSFRLVASSASYSLSGSAVGLLRSRIMAAGSGAYLLSGSSAALNKGASMPAASAAFSLTGSPAAFAVVHFMVASAGSYALSGSAANLSAQHRMTAEGGVYAFYGQPVTLTLVRTVIFHDISPATAAVVEVPPPALVPLASAEAAAGVPTLFTLAAAVSPPAAFIREAAPDAVELEA